MKKRHTFNVILFAVFMLYVGTLEAQCPMCKMSAESNLANGGSAGKGLNAGILYMLAMPYLLVGTLGFIWYRNRKKVNSQLNDDIEKEIMI